MNLVREPLGPFATLEECLRYRQAYGEAAAAREGMHDPPWDRDELAARLLAKQPADADGPTRMGTRDGALGVRSAW